jgi:Predicted permease
MLLTAAMAVIALTGIYFTADLLGPLFMGWLIVIICFPAYGVMRKIHAPKWMAAFSVILLAFIVLAVMMLLLFYAGSRFVDMVPQITPQLNETMRQVILWLHSAGLDAQAADALASFLEPSNLLSWATSISSAAIGAISAFFFVICYVIFIAADGSRMAYATEMYGQSAAPSVSRFSKFNSDVRRYFTVNATFGGIVAIIDGIALWALDVPGPAVWGILAFVTNFIPNIGFIIGMAPPTILAFVVGDWQLAVLVVAIYCVINVVLQVLIQPKFVADAVNLNLTLSFFSVVFWTFIIGPIGAILSVPLTLAVRALVLGDDPSTSWLRWLSGESVTEPKDTEDTPVQGINTVAWTNDVDHLG